jgi:dethiobiotin synthetase/adenosylmethionine--8-amino-7-oxononanoate aminotransferase
VDWNIHARVLGNVLYLMASQTAKGETLRAIEGTLKEVLL